MADYDPKIIPTLDDIIEDELDEEIKETVVDLSSLLAENSDDDDDDFDLFAAEVGVDDPATNTNNDDGSTDDAGLDITSENSTTIEVDTEDDSPSIGTIDDIDMTDDLNPDAAHSTELDMSQAVDRDLYDASIELDTSIPDIAEKENFSEESSSDETPEADTSETKISEIKSVTSESDEFIADEIEISNIEPDGIEPGKVESGETEPAGTTPDEIEVNDIEIGEIDLYADEKLSTLTIEEDLPLPDEEEPAESALIDYHAEQDNDVVLNTHREAQEDSSANYSGDHSAEAVTEDSMEQKIELDTEPATVSETITETSATGISKISLEEPADTSSEDTIDELPETALITENDAISNAENETLASITLEDLSENIIQTLMPELEQQLRFLVLKTLHEKLPAEITRQLSPNSASSDDEDNSDI